MLYLGGGTRTRWNPPGMGIHGLAKLLGDYAPSAIKENDFKSYFGKVCEAVQHHLDPLSRKENCY